MKNSLQLFALVLVTMATQRLLGQPQTTFLATAILLPMPWVIGPPLLLQNRRWYWLSFAIGFAWDLLFEPVVGIGAIAWSAPALMTWLASTVAS